MLYIFLCIFIYNYVYLDIVVYLFSYVLQLQFVYLNLKNYISFFPLIRNFFFLRVFDAHRGHFLTYNMDVMYKVYLFYIQSGLNKCAYTSCVSNPM